MRGKLLGGRYRVIKILAKGGFGQTYVAQDLHRPGNPQCVVKQLKPASTNSGFLLNARRLFQTEAETLERLGSHDQIPRLLAYFEEKQEFYLVQEFIQGHLLSDELYPNQYWSESQVCRLLQEVLSVLEFVHNQGVIHRDIKPDNLIRCQQDNRLVLVDFGTVKQIRTQILTVQGQVSLTVAVGTPGYMPTEQVRGKPRPNSDIYALGIVGVQALTGLHPTQFHEDSDGEIVWQHRAPYVSDALASILKKMVRYHFKERYQTAAEVLQALEPLANKLGSEEVVGIPAQQPHAPQPTAFSPLPSQDVPATTPPQQPYAPEPTAFSLQPSQESLSVSASQVQPSKAPQPTAFSPQPSQDNRSSQNIIPAAVATSTTAVNSEKSSVSANRFPKPSPQALATSIATPQVTIPSPLAPEVPSSHQSIIRPTTLNQRRLLVGAGITTVFISLIAGFALYWQSRPTTQTTQVQIEPLANRKSEECVDRSQTDASALTDKCQLAQAQNLAADRKFKEAIIEAGKIPQDAASYQDAQKLIERSSESILEMATNTYNLGNINNAIATAKTIPETSPIYQKAQGAIKQWNVEWQKNNSYLKAARKALNEGKWQNAISEAKKVTDRPDWKKQIEPIIQQAESKIAVTKPKRAVTKRVTPTATRRAARTATRPSKSTTNRRVAGTANRRSHKRVKSTFTNQSKRTSNRQPVGKTPKRQTSWSDLVQQTGSRR